MIKRTNITTKKDFQTACEWAGQSIQPVDTNNNITRAWIIRDRFLNEWRLTFTGEVGAFKINFEGNGYPVAVYLSLSGDRFEILEAVGKGRTIRSERLLKKYLNLALMASNYFRFGFLKI